MKQFLLAASLFLISGISTTTIAQQNKLKVTIDHVAIYVVDLEKEAGFYRDVLQFDTLAEPFHDGKHAWFTIGSGIAMHLIQGADKPKEYFKNNHICMSVPSIEAFTKRLESMKIGFEDKEGKQGGITSRVDGIHQIWLKDPEGYWIEVNDAKH
jgi:lactoylglutathione lyase